MRLGAGECGLFCPLKRTNYTKTPPDLGLNVCRNPLIRKELADFGTGTS